MNKQRRTALAGALPLIVQAQTLLAQARAVVSEVRDDEQDAYGNMSEGAQEGERGEAMQAAIADLDDAMDGVDVIDLKAVAEAIRRVAEAADEVAPVTLDEKAAEARRTARLPGWAQRRLADAAKAAADADARLAGMFADRNADDPTEAVLDDYMSPIRGKVLPTRQVMFPGLGVRVMVSMRGKEPVLEIQAVNIGMLSILPQASNTVLLRVEGL